ncbi:hypothetical protein LTR84_007202 [Exophiala bonariae]|uniref:Haloacid dehalogenase, type II n=1 Tax=Exophiala bonariae TaxID=1690606 RepID=A0AAV9N1F0_9EURO|nr:hypothetical protein LTR84_007202 [Exophiala bonariae]
MSKLTEYRLLSFDVYGTLIDWETGILEALKPLLSQLDESNKPTRTKILDVYHVLEKEQQTKTPDMPYSQLLATVYPRLAEKFGLPKASTEAAETFGNSVGKWPAFPDTVDALNRLHKYYKLVVLSNVDKGSFERTNAGPLGAVKFDRIITAQEIGSYKPDLRNFEYMLKTVKEELGVDKAEVLQTAQSQFHDHGPAKKMGIKSVWIERNGTIGNQDELIFDWKFKTLGEMADAVEKE